MAFGTRPSWFFPVPVRKSSFHATGNYWSRFNVEVANDRIAPYVFDRSFVQEVLWYDHQTQLEGNVHGSLGSGRSGIYLGHYLKGVGRTPAAANWNTPNDRYSGSGHLSVASALRERMITLALASRGMQKAVVPCRTVLLRSLSDRERIAVRSNATSSQTKFVPADSRMCALTVKPADFARPSNFIFALNHFSEYPRNLGMLFLNFEHYLRPPDDRKKIDGDPRFIAEAMEASFFRGLENLEAFVRMGLLWVYLRGNFILDGRYVDLESPHFFGFPFMGIRIGKGRDARELIGFEEFQFIRYWRIFLDWFEAQITYLCTPCLLAENESRMFLSALKKEVAKRFPRNHILFKDTHLQVRAAKNLENNLDLSAQGRIRLKQMSRAAFNEILYAGDPVTPDRSWRIVDVKPAPALPFQFRYSAPDFLAPRLSPDAEEFASTIRSLESETNLDQLLKRLRT